MRLPRPPDSLIPDRRDAITARLGETEEGSRLRAIVAPHWNAVVARLEQKGAGELRELLRRHSERLEEDDRRIRPLEIEAALLGRLREAYEWEIREHGATTRVAESVGLMARFKPIVKRFSPVLRYRLERRLRGYLDRTRPEDLWWVWRPYSASAWVLECREPDEIWSSVQHPYNLARAYDGDRWIELIARIRAAQDSISARMLPMLEGRDLTRFQLEVVLEVMAQYDREGAVETLPIEEETSRTSQAQNLTPRQVEFLKTGLDVLNEAESGASRTSILDGIDLAIQRKIELREGVGALSNWPYGTAKRVAKSLDIYRTRTGGRTRASREVEQAEQDAFKAELRRQAESFREASVNEAGGEDDPAD